MVTTTGLLTAEEYRLKPETGRPSELVRGRVVERNVPAPRHGYYCGNIVSLLGAHVKRHDLGRIIANDAGVVTQRDPDTVRGADVAFYSYERLPRGPLPDGYLPVVPEMVFEVRSPTDRWAKITVKVGEYLDAGVTVVCVLDPQTESLTVYRADEFPRVLTAEDDLTLPEVLGEFRVKVREFLD
jgi:Uma2 family endonuclease